MNNTNKIQHLDTNNTKSHHHCHPDPPSSPHQWKGTISGSFLFSFGHIAKLSPPAFFSQLCDLLVVFKKRLKKLPHYHIFACKHTSGTLLVDVMVTEVESC